MDKLRDYLRISDAAEYLGVSPNTLRNWEKAGKVVAYRHPVNDYGCSGGKTSMPCSDRRGNPDGPRMVEE